jgi:hypothetical protein
MGKAMMKSERYMTPVELNTFKRKYFNLSKPVHANQIVHDTNTSPEHRRILYDICDWLIKTKRVFYTKVVMKTGEIVDIVAPELPRPCIEIRHTEEKKDKDYSKEYDHLRIFVDVSDPFKLL